MQHGQSTISSAMLGVIRDHISINERPIPHLYLDSKGNPTIGVGFKIDSEDQFAKLNVKVTKNNKEVPATQAEKRQAYRQILTVRKNLISGKKNPNDNPFQKREANSYEKITNTRMKEPEMNAKLDREIVTRIGDIRAEAGDAAWNKLSPEQQAAIVDIDFNTNAGSLKGFPKLKQAIIDGDAKAMARESLIFTDKANGARNHERLSRNYAAFSGQPKPEADRELATLLKNKGEELPDFLQKSLMEAAVAAENYPGDGPVTDKPGPDDPPDDPTGDLLSSPTDGVGGDPSGAPSSTTPTAQARLGVSTGGSVRKPHRPSPPPWRSAAPTA